MKAKVLLPIALASGLFLSGCANNGGLAGFGGSSGEGEVATSSEQEVRTGTVASVESVQIKGKHNLGIGTVLGGVAGGLVGSLFGGGTGKVLTTIAGAVGGAYVGDKIQEGSNQPKPGERIVVKTQQGLSVTVIQHAGAGLRVGQRVRIVGSGSDARVQPL